MSPVLMSGGSSFQSRGAATLNARSPSLSLACVDQRDRTLKLTVVESAYRGRKLAVAFH